MLISLSLLALLSRVQILSWKAPIGATAESGDYADVRESGGPQGGAEGASHGRLGWSPGVVHRK